MCGEAKFSCTFILGTSFGTDLVGQNIPSVSQSAQYHLQTSDEIRPQMNSDLVCCAAEM